MRRRSFLLKSVITTMSVCLLKYHEVLGKNLLLKKDLVKVNGPRIETRIMEMAKFGRDAEGRGQRVAFSKGDIDGRAWLMNLMKSAGMEVSIDAGGNISGKRKGKDKSLKPIAFGSHIDMVPDGGNYDGTLGSISALEVIEILNENKITTNHPLEMIVFANEEGGTIGSMAMAGLLDEEGLNRISQAGVTMRDGIALVGGKPNDLKSCVRQQGDIHVWIELHIEQGGILESENRQIGVVEGIVGMMDWEISIEGVANHAGSTPMKLRKDALLAASKLVVGVNEVINGVPGKQVGTVGRINALPGATNVIPGKVSMSLEIRDLSMEKVETLFNEVKTRAERIAAESQTRISFEPQFTIKPALSDKSMQEKINQAAKTLGYTTNFMQSGAIHDSQNMSRIAPMAMIFVPSVGGISHSPKEFTKPEDMTNGANVLLQTILAIDR